MFASRAAAQPSAKPVSVSASHVSKKRPNEEQDTPDKRQRRFTSALARLVSLLRWRVLTCNLILSDSYARGDSFSDFEIVCNGVTFPVHRLILSMHSRFFERLCKSQFREGQERRVDLSANPLGAVCLMVDYFYTFGYSWNDESLKSLPQSLARPHASDLYGRGWFLIHAQLFVLADKYDVRGLGILAAEHFGRQVERILGEGRSNGEIHAAAADLLEATSYVYENIAPENKALREMILRAFQGRQYRLIRYAKKRAFENMLAKTPDQSLLLTTSRRYPA